MEKKAKYWNEIHLKYNSTYDDWLNKYINLFSNDHKIVELGCGKAYCSKYLLSNDFKNIIACDISDEALKIVNNTIPELKTLLFDMSKGLPFEDESINIVIADLSLHYFDSTTTQFVFEEISRVLSNKGLLLARVNSINDKLHIPKKSRQIEENIFYDGNIYKRFFDFKDFEELFKNFNTYNLIEYKMDRYEKEKVVWEFCLIKKKSN